MNALRIPRASKPRRGPDLTPVMDVVFILVVFFLVVSTFSETLVKPMRVTLPGTTSLAAGQQLSTLRLTASGATLNGERVDAATIAARLAATAGVPLIIETSDDAPYQALVDALDAAQLAGITSVSVQAGGEVAQ